jgi:undecaprenyl-diphosphatase
LLHRPIKEYLFYDGPVAAAMIVGGLLILLVEQVRHKPRSEDLESITWGQALAVGFAQIAALFPGFSRSAATILGGLLVGMNRPVATQFSFYLAIPTLGAASIFALIQDLPHLSASDVPMFAVGFVMSFLSAAVVIRSFLAFVRTRTFRPFAWYRIVVGAAIAIWVAM